jgi:hypothetical protein
VSTVRRLQVPTPSDLVDLLTAPGSESPVELGRLVDAIAARLAKTHPTRPRRIDAFVAEFGAARFTTAFHWSARAARRPLGTAALRRVAAGTSRDLLRAAHEEMETLCDRAQRGLARRGALGTWLAAAPTEVRALCAAEAATWAWGLCHLVDLHAHADRVAVGVPDAWFDVPRARTTLHGRRDATGTGVAASGVLRLRDGAPGARALDGLLVDALVAAMAGRVPMTPARVVGAWPDAGIVLCVELDDVALRHAARLVVTCGSSLTTTATPSVEPVLAA